jgi:bidirectional [NiFe] hydrogenase diaphorase subunit
VETFGCIAPIILNGGAWYNAIGVPGNSGTKVFSVSGDVDTVGVLEVPLGTPLRELVEMAGGVSGGEIKAVQTGGASGGCIPANHLDTPVDYESLTALGTILGSGGLIVMNDWRCMPDMARFFMRFCQDESCGKCAPCRAGTQEAGRMLDRITGGGADQDELERLEELCYLMRDASLCGLGMSAPSPVLSTLRWFREEYEAHIRTGRCPGGVCSRESNHAAA